MATFMESCRCKGARPQGVVAQRSITRPDLAGRLLHDRHVARFLIAPEGYGKSTAAFEYASIVFGFEHMFWIRCASPCFLRDLDSGVLFSALCASDPEAALVVCDDVPVLDDERAAAFNDFIDAVLAQGCEIIVTASPAADTFSHLQRDRMLLDGHALLMTDDELLAASAQGHCDPSVVKGLADPGRAACLLWHEEGMEMLLKGAASEDLPADIALGMLVILVLGDGAFDDLLAFISAERAMQAWAVLAAGYPYLGIDERTAAFAGIRPTMQQIDGAFSHRLADLATGSMHGDADALISCMGDALLARGSGERACDLVSSFATKQAGAAWLIRRCRDLVRAGFPLRALTLHDAVRKSAKGMLDQLSLCRCWASFALDDSGQLREYARRVDRSATASAPQKLTALSLVMMGCDPDEAEPAARKMRQHLDDRAMAAGGASEPLSHDGGALARMCMAWHDAGLEAAAAAWMEEREAVGAEGGLRDALMICAARLFSAASESLEAPSEDGLAAGSVRDVLEPLAQWCGQVAGEAVLASPDRFASRAITALQALAESHPALSGFAPGEQPFAQARTMELALAEQRERGVAGGRVPAAQARRARSRTRIGAELGSRTSPPQPQASIPMLTVNLFGGMEIRIGGDAVDPRHLSRMKVKTLLALLVVHRGRELQRDALALMLWPDSAESSYRNNFYSIWSHLKQSLQIDGECPYLIRTQTGCRLDPRLVRSDVYEYESICRSLLFGTEGASDWERLYAAISKEYAGELMPCETGNPTIASLREHYHDQLVDGLIATAGRLIGAGEPRGALWFAREARRREGKREDVYIALMESQIAADQRSAALATYFECRRFLNEELGIDPSVRLVDLYRSIIETEARL